MRIPYDLPSAGLILRWIGLLAVVLAIIGGIVGMHGLNGAPTHSMAAGATGHTTIAADSLTTAQPTVSHTAWESDHPANEATLVSQVLQPEADCPLAECTYVMAMHGSCIPNVSSPALHVPLPGTLSTHAPGAAFALVPGAKSADRIPDPPSLEKLSISRT